MEGTHRFADDTVMLAMFPHMHLRGQAFTYEARYPDGRREVLLDIPAYDFAWQNAYLLAAPKLLPAGTVLHCTALFDNSAGNRSNPDPAKTVRWGDQTWEEMMIGYFDAYIADQDLFGPKASRRDRFLAAAKAGKASAAPDLLAAAQAATGDKAFEAFAQRLRLALPMVDRVDVAKVDGDQVRFLAKFGWGRQGPLGQVVNYPVDPAKLSLPGDKAAIPGYAAGKQVVENPNLGDARAFDMRYIGRAFGSGVHLPLGSKGDTVLSVYSRDKDAFPPEAVAILKAVAAAAPVR